MAAPVLNGEHVHSATWKVLREYAEKRLAALRVKNDSPQTEEQTNRLRGRIAELKNLLALDKPAPETEADDI